MPVVSLLVVSLLGSVAAQKYIEIHNRDRCLHCNTPTVVFDAALAADAQAYAQTCPTGHASSCTGSGATCLNGAGENLAWKGSTNAAAVLESDANWETGIAGWYDEIKDWSFASSASTGGVTGHFTQMVWTSTTKVGCGYNAACTNKFGGSFKNNAIVCRYKDAGNFHGQYAAKVHNTVASGTCGAAHASCSAPAAPASSGGGASSGGTPSAAGNATGAVTASSGGLDGGAVFGIVLLVLIGVGFLGIVGYHFGYKKEGPSTFKDTCLHLMPCLPGGERDCLPPLKARSASLLGKARGLRGGASSKYPPSDQKDPNEGSWLWPRGGKK